MQHPQTHAALTCAVQSSKPFPELKELPVQKGPGVRTDTAVGQCVPVPSVAQHDGGWHLSGPGAPLGAE